MKIIKSDLQRVAVNPDQYPKDDLPEIAFAGRSNVGKSSFINSMINRKNLARTSSTPGKTRTINFYLINENFRLVDLPGYGYARVSKAEKEKWGYIIEEYLHERENLKEVVLVIDMRHTPTKDDVMMYDWIKSFDFKGIVIATKADKISQNKRSKHKKDIEKKLNIKDSNLVIPYSSIDKLNRKESWQVLSSIIR